MLSIPERTSGSRIVSLGIPHDEKSGMSWLVNASEEPALFPAADTHGRQKTRKLIRKMILGGLIHGSPNGVVELRADYPGKGAELTGIQYGSPGILNRSFFF